MMALKVRINEAEVTVGDIEDKMIENEEAEIEKDNYYIMKGDFEKSVIP